MTSATMNICVSRFAIQICKQNKRIDGYRRHLSGHNSVQTDGKVLVHLNDRSILHIRGNETSSFLQGLITNDMKHLEEGAPNIYTLFLNTKGRVMYDAIVYKNEKSNSYYVECDSQVAESLQRHLKMYRVRRKIDIDHIGDKINVWSTFDSTKYFDNSNIAVNENGKRELEGMIFPCGTLNSKASKIVDDIMIYEDPRLPDLGLRILADSQIDRHEITKHLGANVLSEKIEDYRAFRYKLGVGEGIHDLPPGKTLPLEINCDYLHGVSFHKGCYIGQELTARTYHTGVVRKRLMPLIFDNIANKSLAYDEKILNESSNVVGKFRGYSGKYGLGLMRINESLSASQLIVSDINVKVIKPAWWPQEVQKKIVSSKETQ